MNKDLSVKMRMAYLVSHYAELSCNDVRTAMTDHCNCGDRKLRYLAEHYRNRNFNGYYPHAYEYMDKWYYFKKGFRRFCDRWLKNELKRLEGKTNKHYTKTL